jgi:hypothetical protein
MSEPKPEENAARQEAIRQARQILVEHFEAGFIVVTHSEGGETAYAFTEWGNKFALTKLAEDYADGALDPESPGDEVAEA